MIATVLCSVIVTAGSENMSSVSTNSANTILIADAGSRKHGSSTGVILIADGNFADAILTVDGSSTEAGNSMIAARATNAARAVSMAKVVVDAVKAAGGDKNLVG